VIRRDDGRLAVGAEDSVGGMRIVGDASVSPRAD
jgi:hypothetical protein